MKSAITFDFSDVEKFRKTCKEMGEKTALKAANRAAQKASNILGKEIRANAPKRTGALKSAFKKKKEHSRYYGKIVYYYAVDKAKNEIFQKPIKDVGRYGGKKEHGYYPASVEYGFLVSDKSGNITRFVRHARGYNQHTRDAERRTGIASSKTTTGQRLSSRKVPGQHFVKKAADSKEQQVQQEMKNTLSKELDKLWQK